MQITFTTPLIAAAALTLAACGGDAAKEDADAGAEETAATETAGEGDGKDAPEADAGDATDDATGEEAGTDGGSGKDGAEGDSAAAAAPTGERIAVDFGTDDGEWANDGECDDPRFEGPGMTETQLLVDDIRNDAIDCREAFERGELSLRG